MIKSSTVVDFTTAFKSGVTEPSTQSEILKVTHS